MPSSGLDPGNVAVTRTDKNSLPSVSILMGSWTVIIIVCKLAIDGKEKKSKTKRKL